MNGGWYIFKLKGVTNIYSSIRYGNLFIQRCKNHKEDTYQMNEHVYRRANDKVKSIHFYNPYDQFRIPPLKFILSCCENFPKWYIPK